MPSHSATPSRSRYDISRRWPASFSPVWGSYGDLFPSISIAARPKALGHTPVLATCGYYRGVVEGEGMAFHAARPDVDPAAADVTRRGMDPKRGAEVVIKELIVAGVRDAYVDLLAAARGADLIVSRPVTFAAPLVAGKLNAENRPRDPLPPTVMAARIVSAEDGAGSAAEVILRVAVGR